MSKWMLIGLLTLMPWSTATTAAAGTYDANQCQAFSCNMDPPFTVPAGGQYRTTIDMTQCGGLVQNYQITLMTAKHGVPYATLQVLDASGHSVGVSDPAHHVVYLGNVPANAVYTVVVTSGSKRAESCIIYCTGAI